MPKPPELTSLILCDHLEIDPLQGGRMSLIDVFRTLSFPRFPTPSRAFTVYCACYGGEGEGTISLVVSKWPEEKDVYRYQRWTAFSTRSDYIDLEIPVRKCCFPEAGHTPSSSASRNTCWGGAPWRSARRGVDCEP